MTKKLAGKIALITGGSAGIGLATAQAFVAEGAKVFITGRRQAELDAAVRLIGENVIGVQGDVTNLADLDRLYGEIKRSGGRLDVIFVNAGGGSFLSLASMTEVHYAEIFDRNVKAVLFTVQKALPLLVDGASVILAGSIAGAKGTVGLSVYGAAKAAVRNFARSWLLELKGRGIRVNIVSPGPTLTPAMSDLAPNKEALPRLLAQMASLVPMGRMGQPEEIANAAVFLASSDSSFVNGIELFVDGGLAQV
jgi:NAD(P)-dependent dehydrogenase (short-subunit alcohol dehydrogenase family)